jgi:hypothetical protein
MLGLRLRLAPAWLRAQPRRRPLPVSVAAIVIPVIFALIVAIIVLPRPQACQWQTSAGPVKAHYACPNRPQTAGKPLRM